MTEEAALVAAFLHGREERAFRALYHATAPAAYGLALRLAGGDGVEAAELVQEAWVRAIDRIDRYRTGSAWTPWLRGFVVNCWRERMRSRLRRSEVDLDDALPDEDAAFGAVLVDATALHDAVRALPESYRAAIVLHDVEGYTHEEIADLLAITPGTSRSRLARARARLRAVLDDCDAAPTARRNNTRDSHDATR